VDRDNRPSLNFFNALLARNCHGFKKKEFRLLRCYTVHEILSSGAPAGSEIKLTAASPEEAARLALGETLVRGGHSRRLRAKVYTTDTAEGLLTMVRLYTPVEASAARPRSQRAGS
jgi:hypothetical protein